MKRRDFLKGLLAVPMLGIVNTVAANPLKLTSDINRYTPRTAEELYKAMNLVVKPASFISDRAYEEYKGEHLQHIEYALGIRNTNKQKAEERLVSVMWGSFLEQRKYLTKDSEIIWRRVPEFSSGLLDTHKISMRYSISRTVNGHQSGRFIKKESETTMFL